MAAVPFGRPQPGNPYRAGTILNPIPEVPMTPLAFLAVERRMPPVPVSPRLARAGWLEARLDALPEPDGDWPTDRLEAEEALEIALEALPDAPVIHCLPTPGNATHVLWMLGIEAVDDTFAGMCRRWVAKARGRL